MAGAPNTAFGGNCIGNGGLIMISRMHGWSVLSDPAAQSVKASRAESRWTRQLSCANSDARRHFYPLCQCMWADGQRA